MKSTIKKPNTEVKEEFNLTEAFVLWKNKSQAGNEYLSGTTSKDLGSNKIVGFFNTNKKNAKEPDVRIYTLDTENHADKEIADLWENVSKNEKRYLSGTTDEKEKLVGFYNEDKDHEDRPYIRTYFNN